MPDRPPPTTETANVREPVFYSGYAIRDGEGTRDEWWCRIDEHERLCDTIKAQAAEIAELKSAGGARGVLIDIFREDPDFRGVWVDKILCSIRYSANNISAKNLDERNEVAERIMSHLFGTDS